MNHQPFALWGLASRGGLSNWVCFFLPTETIMIDVGAKLAITRGFQAGVAAQFGLLGIVALTDASRPQNGQGKSLDDWRAELQAKAMQVHVVADAKMQRVSLQLRTTAHQRSVIAADGSAPHVRAHESTGRPSARRRTHAPFR
jgi:endonuclease/exonuclease/phosphatase family metal-dependent hydrolase